MINNNIKVVCFDPGVTTGYAHGVINDGTLGCVSGQAKWTEYELYVQLKLYYPDIIIYEDFVYRRGQDRAELFPRNLIGVINLYNQERANEWVDEDGNHRPVEVYHQTPSQGKGGQFSDKVLKESRMYKEANPHANDAMRHLLYWFTFGPGFKYNTNGYEPLA